MGGETEANFWAALGGRTEVKAGEADEETKEVTNDRLVYNFYHVSDATGKMKVEVIEERPLRKEMLDSNDSYILEMYDKVYVWQGKGATLEEKKFGIAIANKHKEIRKKPKGTTVTRVPEGCEDIIWKSFFEGYYANDKEDFGKGKAGIDMSTSANQNISKITNQHLKAAAIIKDKLGKIVSQKTYVLSNSDLRTPQEIGVEENGIFFSENIYVVDIVGQEHRYLVCWQGYKLTGEQLSQTSTAIEKICKGELSSNMSRMNVLQCQEPEDFLQFFASGFVIARGPRIPLT